MNCIGAAPNAVHLIEKAKDFLTTNHTKSTKNDFFQKGNFVFFVIFVVNPNNS